MGDINTNALSGRAGVDALFGGLGNDVLTGGAGGDYFAWSAADFAAGQYDVVTDFSETVGNLDYMLIFGLAAGDVWITEWNGGVILAPSALGFGLTGGGVYFENLTLAQFQDQIAFL